MQKTVQKTEYRVQKTLHNKTTFFVLITIWSKQKAYKRCVSQSAVNLCLTDPWWTIMFSQLQSFIECHNTGVAVNLMRQQGEIELAF